MRRRFLNNEGFSSFYNFEDYLTIESLEDDLRISFSSDIEYGIDGKGWKMLSSGREVIAKAGRLISFKGTFVPNSEIGIGKDGIGKFTINKKCRLRGNVLSLLWGDEAKGKVDLTGYKNAFVGLFLDCSSITEIDSTFLPATTLADYCYYNMFSGCTSLVNAPELPATTLADYCYYNMFSGCTSLTTAPVLPATTLAYSCYYYMFIGCTALTTAPELPATTLASYCYNSMFYGCKNLTTAPALPATTLANSCYNSMFRDCTSLTTAPELPATTLAIYCYNSMFYSCTSLTTAPALPATTLANSCYYGMFSGCTSLTTAPVLPATTLAYECYERMFRDCTSLTRAPELPATTLANRCYDSMFYGCTSLTRAPELPATTLVSYCYYYMFYGCNKLNYIKMLATHISAIECLYSWVRNVASTGTFVKNPNMTSLPTGNSGIPSGWTVVNDGEESGGNLIAFTIDGTEYQAEEGMNWSDWVDSEYNINMTFGIDEFEGTTITNGARYVGTLTDYVKPSDLIIANYEYLLTW